MDSPPDFRNNSSWFSRKLLTDANSLNPNKGITETTYYTAMGKAIKVLNFHANHKVHLGRVLGSCASEMDEDAAEDLRVLGNWNPNTQETLYSTKLPMKIIQSRAGFRRANGLHYNPCVTLIPQDELLRQI